MTYSLEGYRALVCGSTQGIGRACAIEMARQGAEVTLMARHEQALTKVRSELPAPDGQAHRHLVADFTSWQTVRDRATGFQLRRVGWGVFEIPVAVHFNDGSVGETNYLLTFEQV